MMTFMNSQTHLMRILVADDSLTECALLDAELRTEPSLQLIGFVHDGVEAINYLRGVEEFKQRESFPYPDLLLLDFSMPRCDGMGVLAFLRRQFHRPRVILWSNTLERVSVPLALRMGADVVCCKPSSKIELLQLIQRVKATVFRDEPVSTCGESSEVVCPRVA